MTDEFVLDPKGSHLVLARWDGFRDVAGIALRRVGVAVHTAIRRLAEPTVWEWLGNWRARIDREAPAWSGR